MGMTVEWGDDKAAEREWERWRSGGQQSMSDREEEDHFMGC